jgi:nitrogen fixation NifU-like protein
MSELKALYQEIILDHNRKPRNFKAMQGADRTIEGYNPLCGDHYTLYLKFDGETISDISFQGAGCAISKASASIMSSVLKGKSKGEAEHLFQLFHRLVKGDLDAAAHLEELGKLAAFAGVSDFPARVKCASLAWHSMHGALRSDVNTVSTE